MAIKKLVESWCYKCGRFHAIEDFNKSPNPHHINGVLPVCKEGCRQIFNDYLDKYQSMEGAMWLTCSELGVPFIDKVYTHYEEKVKKRKEQSKSNRAYYTYNHFGNYMASLVALKTKIDKWEDFSDTNVQLNQMSLRDKAEAKLAAELEKFKLDWGEHNEDEYTFLEYRFDTYTKDIPLTTAQETLYRQLCLVELQKREKEDRGDSTKEQQAMILTLMKTLGIDNFKNVQDKSEDELIIEKQIWEIENTEPCEVIDQEKYKDFCDIKKNWGKEILRAVKNIVSGSRDFPDINETE